MILRILRGIYVFIVDTFQTLLLAASVFLVIYIFIARPFQVTGESMDPTYKDGEYVLTNLLGMKIGEPKHGDVIVFKAPIDDEKDFIKRVIGVPGDRVMVKEGKVYRNGQLLDESGYLLDSVYTTPGGFLQDGSEVQVPDGQYIVFGDNRPFSSDSREWGFLQKDLVIGSSLFVYWPPQNTRLIKNNEK